MTTIECFCSSTFGRAPLSCQACPLHAPDTPPATHDHCACSRLGILRGACEGDPIEPATTD